MRQLTMNDIHQYRHYLIEEEKSRFTIDKYIRDSQCFLSYVQNQELNKELCVSYKQYLIEKGYSVRSINSMLSSINSLFEYLGWIECKVKCLRVQKQAYSKEEKELTKDDYFKLLESSKQNPRLYLILQTICSTGIRISELKWFTVEAVENSEVCVHCKNKIRTILIPSKLKKMLLRYANQNGITAGSIFVTKHGNPVDRCNIYHQMKRICEEAKVKTSKVFPHNLRKLFARTFYELEKDIAKLADLLGHSSIETTRIYIMTTSMEHQRKIERMNLII